MASVQHANVNQGACQLTPLLCYLGWQSPARPHPGGRLLRGPQRQPAPLCVPLALPGLGDFPGLRHSVRVSARQPHRPQLCRAPGRAGAWGVPFPSSPRDAYKNMLLLSAAVSSGSATVSRRNQRQEVRSLQRQESSRAREQISLTTHSPPILRKQKNHQKGSASGTSGLHGHAG